MLDFFFEPESIVNCDVRVLSSNLQNLRPELIFLIYKHTNLLNVYRKNS